MKVSYPLSLKVSLWLMLNLLLLAALGLGFFVVNGGLRWDALVAGPSGERLQSLANVIAGETAEASGEARSPTGSGGGSLVRCKDCGRTTTAEPPSLPCPRAKFTCGFLAWLVTMKFVCTAPGEA